MFKKAAACLLLPAFCGCSSVNWERALYEGQRKSAEQCRLATQTQGPPPCATLPGYSDYSTERARLRPGDKPTLVAPAPLAPASAAKGTP